MSQQSLQRVCPYLGLIGDPASHFSEPDAAHRCFSPQDSGDVENEYQLRVCFSQEYATCARFVTPTAGTPTVPLTAPEKPGSNRALWLVLLAVLIIVPLAALMILPALLAPKPAISGAVSFGSTRTVVARAASPQPSGTPTAIRTRASTQVLSPINLPTPPTGGTILTLVADPKQTGWVASQDPNAHWGEPDLYAGFFQNQIYVTLVQFDLADLPPGSKILFATLELVGRDTSKLGTSGKWQVDLIDWHSKPDGSAPPTPNDILNAPSLSAIGSAALTNLGIGAPNRFEFDSAKLGLFEKQLNNGVLTFRVEGPVAGADSLFTWEGSANTSNTPPTLYVVAIPGAFVVVTSTPTPANVLTAAADAARATTFARQYGTPTRMRGIVTPTADLGFIDVTPVPTPANAATAQFLSGYATAVALTTGTMSSPWPPSTMAWISSTATLSSMAMKQR